MSATGIDLDWIRSEFPELSSLNSLAGGGQKFVLSADHADDGRVVLKLIHSSHGAKMVEREILAVQQIDAPRVPTIHAAGQLSSPIGEVFWFREQRIDGKTVREALRDGPFSAEDVLRLGAQCLECLVRAEAQAIVHRDVKPENIIRDEQGDFWLLDFGIARHLELSPLTHPSSPFGRFTPGYAPPEQFRNIQTEIDSRADLFALGVTMYECATGVNPFHNGARDQLEILRRVERDVLPRLALPLDGSEKVADFVSALTQRRRDHRPASAEAALEWLGTVRG